MAVVGFGESLEHSRIDIIGEQSYTAVTVGRMGPCRMSTTQVIPLLSIGSIDIGAIDSGPKVMFVELAFLRCNDA